MADEEIRQLERALEKDLDNEELKGKLVNKKAKIGEAVVVSSYKIQQIETGKFLQGLRRDYYSYPAREYLNFTKEGKTWNNMEDLNSFLIKVYSKEKYQEKLDDCRIVEFMTMTIEARTLEITNLMKEFSLREIARKKKAAEALIKNLEKKEKTLTENPQEKKVKVEKVKTPKKKLQKKPMSQSKEPPVELPPGDPLPPAMPW